MAVKQEKQDERAAVNQKAEKLLKDYGNSILRMAYAYLHNMSDAEDILQETLMQYLQTAPVLENPAHEKAWLLKVAANLSKNRIDYNRIRQTDELEENARCRKARRSAFCVGGSTRAPGKIILFRCGWHVVFFRLLHV